MSRKIIIAPCQQVVLQAKQQIQQSGELRHSHDNFLSLDYGFTFPTIPLSALPASHKLWDDYARQLPEWVMQGTTRLMLKDMPLLSAKEEDLPAPYLLRASTILTILAHAYYAGDYLGRDTINLTLPHSIKKPWTIIAKRLKRKHLNYTVCEGVLYNWRFKTGAPHQRITEHTELLVPLVGNKEESISHMVLAETETTAIPLIKSIIDAQNAVLNYDNKALEKELATIYNTLDAMLSVFMKINLMPQAITYFHPIIWSRTATVISAQYSKFELGMSGASLPSFNLIDEFLGRTHYKTEMGQQEITRRSLLPQVHQAFIAAAGAISVDHYIKSAANDNLLSLWQQIYEKFSGKQGFLGVHQRKIYSYIQMGMKAGRLSTNAGYPSNKSSAAEPWDIIDEELHLGRLERYLLNPNFNHTAQIISISALNSKTTHLEFKTKQNLFYQAGYRCKLYVENSSSLIQKTLNALHADNHSVIELSHSWQAYLTQRLQAPCPPMITLGEFLKYAKIRPLTREIAQSFHTITGLYPIRYILDNHLIDQFELWDFFQFLERYLFDVTQLWKFSPWQRENLSKLLPPELPRTYSISSAYNPNNPNRFSITVGHFYYTTIYDNAMIEREGTGSLFIKDLTTDQYKDIIVNLEKPLFFPLENTAYNPTFFFAGGLGITPFRAAIQEKIESMASHPMYLFLSVRTVNDLLYLDELSDWLKIDKLQVFIVFTQENDITSLKEDKRQKLIHPNVTLCFQKKIDDIISAQLKLITPYLFDKEDGGREGHFYICGSVKFCETTEKALIKLIKKQKRIKSLSLEYLIANKRLSSDVFTNYFSTNIHEGTTFKNLNISEIACHNNETQGYWLILSDSVYDITNYALKHPGGNQILYSCAGLDATDLFKKVEHHTSVQIMSLLESFKIGQVHKLSFNEAKRFITINDTTLTTISLNELYRSWVEILFDIVDIENRLYLAFSCYETSANRLIAKMIVDAHQLFVNQMLTTLYDITLTLLWKKTSAIFAPSAGLFDIELSRNEFNTEPLCTTIIELINRTDDLDLLVNFIIDYDLNWIHTVKQQLITIHQYYESHRPIDGTLLVDTLTQLKDDLNCFAFNFSTAIRSKFKFF